MPWKVFSGKVLEKKTLLPEGRVAKTSPKVAVRDTGKEEIETTEELDKTT